MSSYDTWHNLLSGTSQGLVDKIYEQLGARSGEARCQERPFGEVRQSDCSSSLDDEIYAEHLGEQLGRGYLRRATIQSTTAERAAH